MSTEVDQVSAQEQTVPSVSVPEPVKAPEEAQGTDPTEDKPSEDKAAVAAEPAKAEDGLTPDQPVGATANGTEQEKIAPQEAAVSEPAKAEGPISDEVKPVGVAAGGGEQDAAIPKEHPVMTGAIPSESEPDAPANPIVLPSTEAATSDKKSEETAEKPAGADAPESNGSETKDVDMPAAPEEKADESPVVGDKRKAEDKLVATNGNAKKAKTDATDANGDSEIKKPGRPAKKDKKPQPAPQQQPVGKTVRKTRSQGPVEV